jgi:VanZ family protein
LTFVKLWGPVLLVMGLIYSQSANSDPAAPPGGMSDKSAHFLAYAVLGATVVRALAGGRPAAMTAGRIALAAFVATLYGASDEVHQMFVPNRTPELLDLAADAAGSVAGAAGLAVVARVIDRARRAT